MRKLENAYLFRGYTFRILGIAMISFSPWWGRILPSEENSMMYICAVIGLAMYAVGVIIKARSERKPETMCVKLSADSLWIAIIVLGCAIVLLFGTIYYPELTRLDK